MTAGLSSHMMNEGELEYWVFKNSLHRITLFQHFEMDQWVGTRLSSRWAVVISSTLNTWGNCLFVPSCLISKNAISSKNRLRFFKQDKLKMVAITTEITTMMGQGVFILCRNAIKYIPDSQPYASFASFLVQTKSASFITKKMNPFVNSVNFEIGSEKLVSMNGLLGRICFRLTKCIDRKSISEWNLKSLRDIGSRGK